MRIWIEARQHDFLKKQYIKTTLTYKEFIKNLSTIKAPVVLLEGKRKVMEGDRNKLVRLGEKLAHDLPDCAFRSGNADGADTLFAEGVAGINPCRIQHVVPYKSHKPKNIRPGSQVISVEEMMLAGDSELIRIAKAAGSQNKGLIDFFFSDKKTALRQKALYLIRDALKVTGLEDAGVKRADFGLFYDDLEKPMSGGTGFTMKVCESCNVPFINQEVFFTWL